MRARSRILLAGAVVALWAGNKEGVDKALSGPLNECAPVTDHTPILITNEQIVMFNHARSSVLSVQYVRSWPRGL